MRFDLALPLILTVGGLVLAAGAGIWGADSRDQVTERRDGRAVRWYLEPGDASAEARPTP